MNEYFTHIPTISRFVTAIVLAIAGVGKLSNFRWFLGVLAKYELSPRRYVRMTALVIVFLELAIAGMLFIGRWPNWSAYCALGVFAIFTVAIVVNLIRGKFNIQCGCNSFWRKTKIGWHLVLRNVGLLGLASLSRISSAEMMGSGPRWTFFLSVALILVPLLPKRHSHGQG